MALGSTQPLNRNEYQESSWQRKVDNLTICESIVYKIWAPRRLTTLWASTACYRDSFLHDTVSETFLRLRHTLCRQPNERKVPVRTTRSPGWGFWFPSHVENKVSTLLIITIMTDVTAWRLRMLRNGLDAV
jgi:hypothetical protein